MSTRRERELAVLEAARKVIAGCSGVEILNLCGHILALDACREPDLTDLNAKVAQAFVAWAKRHPKNFMLQHGQTDVDWHPIINAYRLLCAALKPKERYEVVKRSGLDDSAKGCGYALVDNETGWIVLSGKPACEHFAALLNEKGDKK